MLTSLTRRIQHRPLLEFVATRCEKRGLIAAYFSTGALDPENHPNWRTRPQEPINDEPMHAKIAPHTCYIFLHDTSRPTDFPTRKSTQLQRYLQLRASKWGGIVNWTYVPESPVVESPYSKDAETRAATVFSMLGGRLEIPRLSLENLDEVEERLKAHLQGPLTPDTFEEAHIYVCTHGARDCRCGHIGGDVVAALEQELKKRREEDPGSLASRVTVRETAHVGGHKFAANALVFPHGEWLGRLTPEDAPALIDEILDDGFEPLNPSTPPLLPDHWRGRTGLTKEEMVGLWDAYGTTDPWLPVVTAELAHDVTR